MRKKIWIPCVVILGICLLLLLRGTQRQKSISPNTNETNSSQQNQSEQASSPATHQAQNATNMASALPSVSNNVPSAVVSNPFLEKVLPAWQKPINFYGKVVDQNSNAVAGAKVVFGWSEYPTEEGARRASTTSDSEGLFSLSDKRGPALDVWVNKGGYYSSHGGQWAFSYINGFTPDAQNPIIFLLRKRGKGASLIETKFPPGMRIVQLHHDGTPIVLDLLSGSQVSEGNGQLELQLWHDISDENATKFDWKLQLSAPSGGGFIPTDEEFAFQAPQNGYQTSIVIDMPATNQDWSDNFSTRYYIQLPNGNYGRFDLNLLAHNGAFTVSSAINPTGSQNLEPSK